MSSIFTIEDFGYAQVQDSGSQVPSTEIPPSSGGPSTRLPIGLKQGLEELKAVLDASEPAEESSSRRVVITFPEGVPDVMRYRSSATAAIREFYLIAGQQLIKDQGDTPSDIVDFEGDSPRSRKTKLPNGGSIRLRIRKINQAQNQDKAIGELILKRHGVAGYEAVERIEFVSK